MRAVADLAGQVREDRRPVTDTNPFLALQQKVSEGIVRALDSWRDMQERLSEQTFLAIYGTPAVQAAVGLRGADDARSRKPAIEPLRREMIEYRIRELAQRMDQGDVRVAVIRALVYVGMADTSVDERGFAVLQSIRAELREELSLAEFKAIAREQFFMLLVDEARAIAGIGEILRRQPEGVGGVIPLLRRVVSARGDLSDERERRLRQVEALFGGATALPDSGAAALIADGRTGAVRGPGRSDRGVRAND